jgi:hypothetical protein
MGSLTPKSGPPANARTDWLAPAIVSALTFLTFLPCLWNGFVYTWDDGRDLLDNVKWRGFGWENLRWMFSVQFDHYKPLTWLSQ